MTGLISTKTTQDKIPASSMRASNEHDQLPVASGTGGGITALQRAAGNRAVDGLLDSGGKDDGIVTSGVAPIVLGVLKSGRGQRLDPATLEFMESRLGHDFRGVRIHNDAEAESSAREVGATAYTVGHDVVFGSRRYEPQTGGGRRLIAHELAHVVQQERGGVAPTLDRDASYESAARNSADAIAAGQSSVVRGATGVGMARQEDMDPRHARGFAGEQGMGFELYREEDGWIFVEGPSGAGGHGVTTSGFDGVAYNPKTGELHLSDNKSLKSPGNVTSASAIDPSRNLLQNVDDLIARVQAAKNLPDRFRILQLLQQTRIAVVAKQPLPESVKLVVTGIGGQSTGVSSRLEEQGVQFRPSATVAKPQSKGLPPKKLGGIFKKEGEAETRRFQNEQERLLKPPSPATPEEITNMRKAIERGDVRPVDQEVAGRSGSRTRIKVREGGSTAAQPIHETGSTSAEVAAPKAEAGPKAGANPEMAKAAQVQGGPSGNQRSIPVYGEQPGKVPAPLPIIQSASREPRSLQGSHKSFDQFESFKGPHTQKQTKPAGGGAGVAGGAAQIISEIENVFQTVVAHRKTRLAGSIRTLRWWLQRGVQPPVRGVTDRWLRSDDDTPGVPDTAQGAQEGKFDGIEIDRLNEAQQYEAFENWVNANVHTWDDYYRHFVMNEDAGVRRTGGKWQLATWKWGDWFPAAIAKDYIDDERIGAIMEPIWQRAIVRTQKEIEGRAKEPDVVGQGGSTGFARVLHFKRGIGTDRTLYSPRTREALMYRTKWTFEPVFCEIAGAVAPEGYVMVSGADFATYAEIYDLRARYGDGYQGPTIEASDSPHYSEKEPIWDHGPDAIPGILVKREALTDRDN